MKSLFTALVIGLLATLQLSAQTKLPQGTYLQLAFSQNVSSKNASDAMAYVATPLIVDGKTIIEKGTPVVTEIYNKKARGLGRPGNITIQFLSTQSKDGQTIYFMNNKKEISGNPRGGLAYGLGIGLGVFFFPCFACLAIKGEEATIPANMTFTVSTLNDYIIP